MHPLDSRGRWPPPRAVAPEQPLAPGRDETRCTVGIERLCASFVEKRIEGFSRAIASPNCLGSNPGDVVRCLAPEHELECLVEVGVDRSIQPGGRAGKVATRCS